MKTADLIPNGSNIPVTRENRLQYIYLVAHHRLTKQIKKQSTAFFEGLSEIIDPKWLRMFNQQELQILLGGVNAPIDLDDLRSHTQYGGLYDDHEHTIEIFWSVSAACAMLASNGLLNRTIGGEDVQPGRAAEAAAFRHELQSTALTVSPSHTFPN